MQVNRVTVLELLGNVPSKKNGWRRAGAGGVYFDDKKIPRAIESLTMQARSKWRRVSSEPAARPQVSIWLSIAPGDPDPDNQQTTLLDILKKAGVIVDDKAAALTAPLVVSWSGCKSKDVRKTIITITEEAA